jgi:threonine/homoserine/homoserine lactone efflux protein
VWGPMIGLGVAMALQPLPPLATIILLSVERGVVKAFAFFLGVFSAMFAIGAVAVAVKFGSAESGPSTATSVVTLVAGLALLFFGVRFLLRMRRGEAVAEPGWLGRLDRMEPWPAFLLGTFVPTYMIAVAAAAHIVEADISNSEAVVALLAFLAIGCSTVYVPLLLAWLAPERSKALRARVRDWLVRNWVGVASAVLLLVGGYLVAKAAVDLAG